MTSVKLILRQLCILHIREKKSSQVFTYLASIGPWSVTRLVCYWSVARPLFFRYISPKPPGCFGRNHYTQHLKSLLLSPKFSPMISSRSLPYLIDERTYERTHERTHERTMNVPRNTPTNSPRLPP